MNGNGEVLAAIRDLRRDVNKSFADFERRFADQEEKTVNIAVRQQEQQKQIDALCDAVRELARGDSAIWHSRDGQQVGIKKQNAYDKFGELGFTQRQALQAIDEAKMLVKDHEKATKVVRPKGQKLVRAVVIIMKDGEKK